jgi:hypothetical protein
MKNKEYTSICNILTKQLKRKCFPFMDFGEIKRIKYPQIYRFPIESQYKEPKRKNYFFIALGLLLVLLLYISWILI